MKTNKCLGAIIILSMLLALLPAGIVSAGTEKVSVCHLDELGVYHLIRISEMAFPTHQAHGDASPTDWVPGQAGKKFGDNCELIAIPQKTLVDKVIVPASGIIVSSILLDAGQAYELKATGTFTYTGTTWADAEYYLLGGVAVKGDTQGSKPYVLDVSINGYSTNTDWGAYNPAHEYTQSIIGTGAVLNFSIYDSVYSDNNGAITVEIYQINW